MVFKDFVFKIKIKDILIYRNLKYNNNIVNAGIGISNLSIHRSSSHRAINLSLVIAIHISVVVIFRTEYKCGGEIKLAQIFLL